MIILNKTMNNAMIVKTSAFIMSIVFVFVALFGLKLSMISHDPDMMPGCPFMNNESSLCAMSIMEHFSGWQKIFTANSISQMSNISFIYFAMIFFMASIMLQYLLLIAHKYKLYKLERPHIDNFSFYKYFFSQGILHPKIFS